MRILHLSNHCRFANGNVHAAVDLACQQVAEGHTVAFGSSGGFYEPLLQENGVLLIDIPQEDRKAKTVSRAIAALWRTIRKFKPDVIHAHMMTGAIIAWPLTRLTRIPLITTVHNSFERHAIIMGLGDRTIGVSQAVSDEMIRRRVPHSRVRTVLNGTGNVVRRQKETQSSVSLSKPSLISVGGLHPRKGIPYLLEAFDIVWKSHPEATLNILGEGPFRQEYEKQAAALPSGKNIIFYGALEDTKTYLEASDIFVLPSLREPFGLVITEAREADCAIVATNVDGVPEVTAIGDAGLLVPPADAQALAEALLSLLENPALLQAQKEASKRDIDFFDISRVSAETSDVYRDALEKRRVVSKR
ncbi:glycosyltransferase family 4 protein [Kozakia baliensis]|uniref:glycosyltransferase family 4 protein n=1 Tax=Kozakia baliensis TaxID=153496 RepID=UPI000496F532|nr:glycosyltransferase family 4 protein [Kozakia baliensis]AOX20419.1 hypothetical protein A0U90_09025 [Kozakia baliensis]